MILEWFRVVKAVLWPRVFLCLMAFQIMSKRQ